MTEASLAPIRFVVLVRFLGATDLLWATFRVRGKNEPIVRCAPLSYFGDI